MKNRRLIKFHVEGNKIIFDEVLRIVAGETVETAYYIDPAGVLYCDGAWVVTEREFVKKWFAYRIALILLKPIRFLGINTDYAIKLSTIVWEHDNPGKSSNPDDWLGAQTG
jgi:hypothetical protein